MKRGTTRHKKMFHLANLLKVPVPFARGLLVALWEFAAESCPQGDIGSVPDKEIAKAVDWEKKPEALIWALCESKWLDRHEKHRLLIHDWPDHCEFEVCRKLMRAGKDFCDAYGKSARDRRAAGTEMSRDSRGFGAPKSRESHASREAMAKAKASESSEGVQGEASGPRSSTPAIAVASGQGWENFIGLYLAAGKALNEQDLAEGLREWLSLEMPDQLAAFRHLQTEALRSEARFLMFPANYLRKRPWTRVGPGRVLPLQKRTRVDDANEEALRIFEAQQRGGEL